MAKVKVYSTTFCHYCVSLKDFLKENGVAFEEVDVGVDIVSQKEMVEKSGQMGVHVVDIDGHIVVGFDREKISQILGIKI